MEKESCFTRSIIDELHSWDIEGHQIADECSVIRSIIHEIHFWDIQRAQMESENGDT